MQQDADECWGNIMTSLRDKLKVSSSSLLARVLTSKATANCGQFVRSA